jgi:hypothetical protein
VTIGVRATRHSIGGLQMLKPLTHFKRKRSRIAPGPLRWQQSR